VAGETNSYVALRRDTATGHRIILFIGTDFVLATRDVATPEPA
jgi:hypothetical protein